LGNNYWEGCLFWVTIELSSPFRLRGSLELAWDGH